MNAENWPINRNIAISTCALALGYGENVAVCQYGLEQADPSAILFGKISQGYRAGLGFAVICHV